MSKERDSKDGATSEMNKTTGLGGNNNSFMNVRENSNSMIGSKENFFNGNTEDFRVNGNMMMTGMSKHADSDMM